jgi:hypothetical protein
MEFWFRMEFGCTLVKGTEQSVIMLYTVSRSAVIRRYYAIGAKSLPV